MKTSGIIKKGAVLGILFLFIGIIVAPGITADNKMELKSSNKVTLELIGLPGEQDKSITLTDHQLDEIKTIFSDLKKEFNNVDSKEETKDIFMNALQKFKDQGIITDTTSYSYLEDLFSKQETQLNNKLDITNNINLFCLVAGMTTNTYFFGIPGIALLSMGFGFFGLLLYIALFLKLDSLYDFALGIVFSIMGLFETEMINLWKINPMPFMHVITLGRTFARSPKPAVGWVYTLGLLGSKKYENEFYGQQNTLSVYPGIYGFSGLHIFIPGSGPHYYFGCGLVSDIGYDSPYE